LTTACFAIWAGSLLSAEPTATVVHSSALADATTLIATAQGAEILPVAPSGAKKPLSTAVDSTSVDGSDQQAPSCEEALGHARIEPTDDEATVNQTLAEGDKAFLQGNVKGAQAVFCRAVALDPGNFRATYSLAQALLARRDATAAEKWAKEASDLPSDYASRAANLRGDALVRLGRVEAAKQLWLDAANVSANSPKELESYLYDLKVSAARAFNHKDYNNAESLYRRVLTFDAQHEVSRRRLVVTLGRLKQPAAAQFWAK
jgi:tetratricopeptide (TPR) repeat protein